METLERSCNGRGGWIWLGYSVYVHKILKEYIWNLFLKKMLDGFTYSLYQGLLSPELPFNRCGCVMIPNLAYYISVCLLQGGSAILTGGTMLPVCLLYYNVYICDTYQTYPHITHCEMNLGKQTQAPSGFLEGSPCWGIISPSRIW